MVTIDRWSFYTSGLEDRFYCMKFTSNCQLAIIAHGNVGIINQTQRKANTIKA